MTINNKKPSTMNDAESFLKEQSRELDKTKDKKSNKKFITYSIIVIAFVFAAVRFFILQNNSQEATYTVPQPDSASILTTVEMLEEYVLEYGEFPGDIEESINSSEEATLETNSDGSFTYSERGIIYRSPEGILR